MVKDVRKAEVNRPVIYQLLVRTFGNSNETRAKNGSIEQNGCGTFADIDEVALKSLVEMGFTHLWLTGVLEQASGTEYPSRPADDPALLKGKAGSPYAIRDYFDVCPDYASDPGRRIHEFRELVDRCHAEGFKVLIDFVPNHVARSYFSGVHPEESFGEHDDKSVFFDRDNHFYYLPESAAGGGPPLRLPGEDGKSGGCVYEPEKVVGRVTGNNAVTWMPSVHDWYETVKLNYGHDFTQGRDTSHLPGVNADLDEVPRTWKTMDGILAYWQSLGVDGFRCDMAHMVPMEFWRWLVNRCRDRNQEVYFFAEAYDNDPAKLCDGHVLDELLSAGFDAVYDDPVYDVLEGIYDDGKWANDLDALTFTGARFHKSLRYAENHDEVRIANPGVWGGHGMRTGKPVSAILYAMGQGPVMLYHGQEVGEPALEAWGFGGDGGRTSIFDYGSMPEFTKWFNMGACDGAGLSAEQKALRDWYGRLIRAAQSPAFTKGNFYGLNHANKTNVLYGRVEGETVSGHWLYSFLRRDPKAAEAFLVLANLHPDQSLEGVKIRIPEDARMFTGHSGLEDWKFVEVLEDTWSTQISPQQLEEVGLDLPTLGPCTARLLRISVASSLRVSSPHTSSKLAVLRKMERRGQR